MNISKILPRIELLDKTIRIYVSVLLDKSEKKEYPVNSLLIPYGNEAKFIAKDNRHYTFPLYELQWNIDIKSNITKGFDFVEFKKYYIEQIKQTITNKSFALINFKSNDLGLHYLGKFSLENLFDDENYRN